MENHEKERIERVIYHLGIDTAQSVEQVDRLLNKVSLKDIRELCLQHRCSVQSIAKKLFRVYGNKKKTKNISKFKDQRVDKAAAIGR